MGTALSTMIASFGLAFVGFQAGMEPTPQVVNGITYMMAFGPAIVCVLSAPVSYTHLVVYKRQEII